MGLAPQRAAKDGFAVEAVGVVAGGDEECGGGVGSDAVGGEQGEVSGSAQGAEFAVEGGDLGAEGLVAPGEAAQRPFGGADERVGGGVGAQAGAGVDEDAAAQTSELVFERLGDRDEQAVDLVVRLSAGLERGAARDGEHADRLDGAVVGFGHSGGVPGEGAARRGFGVDGVGLAGAAAHLAVGTIHLHHLDAGRGEVARQAGAVAAGAFDADTAHGTPRGQPGGQLAVAGGVRRERRRRQQRPGGINSGGDMDITVRVDPADDLGVLLGHNGAALHRVQWTEGTDRPGRRTGHSRRSVSCV